MQDSSTTPSRRYFARAVERRGGFGAQFSLPGLIPDLVRGGGEPQIFTYSDDAELAAARVMITLANERLGLRMEPDRAMPMSAAELSEALDDLGYSPTDISHMFGTEHVMAWLAGERRVPHMARLLLDLMRDKKIAERVQSLASKKRTSDAAIR